jgi:hypothetical protein
MPVLHLEGSDSNQFRTSGTLRLIRVHVIATPDTTVSVLQFCLNTPTGKLTTP